MAIDFIEQCKSFTKTLLDDSDWTDFDVLERRCEVCKTVVSRKWSSCDCTDHRVRMVATKTRGWLAVPDDLCAYFTPSDYGRMGESVPRANLSVINYELEDFADHFAIWKRLRFTSGGGRFAIDPNCAAVVEFFDESQKSLLDYPLLNEETYSEIEQEMWGSHIEDFMRQDFLQNTAESAKHKTDLIESIVESSPYLNDVVNSILWGFMGYYSADNPGFDDRASKSFGSCLAQLIELENWHIKEPSKDEISRALESREFLIDQVSAGDGYCEPNQSRNLTCSLIRS